MSSQEELLESLQKRLQILEDKDALATLLNTYCMRADEHDWESYSECFLEEDCIMEYEGWGPVIGRDKIQQVAAQAETRFEGLQHTMTNFELQIDGSDYATGTNYLWFCATPKVSIPVVNYAWGGSYRWKFKRTRLGWKINRMHLRRLWSMGQDTEKQWT